jgi:hypothetical protein
MNKKSENKEKKGIFRYVPLWALVLYGVAVLAVITAAVSHVSVGFADFISNTVGRAIRTVFSYATYIFPFSVAEMLLWFSPVILGLVIYLAVKCAGRSRQSFCRFTSGFLALATLVYSLFTFSIGATYYGTKVAEKMGIPRRDVSAEELYETALLLLDGANAEHDEIIYPEGTYSAMPYSYEEMNKKLNAAFAVVSEKYDGIDKLYSRTKPVILSPYWTYTHISGMYTFFTGEANVNTNYPDFIMVSSAAHEMAHQRMVASELEANFVGVAACLSSDNVTYQYSGAMWGLIHLCNALYPVDRDGWYEIAGQYFTPELSTDWNDNNAYWRNLHSKVEEVAEQAYDSFLKGNGQELGMRSYGACVDLLVAYYSEEAKEMAK